MAKPEDILHSEQAEHLLKNKEKLLNMMHSPDAVRLMELLQKNGGTQLQSAADSAMKGKPAQLMNLVQQVMSTPDGARTVQNIQKNLPK